MRYLLLLYFINYCLPAFSQSSLRQETSMTFNVGYTNLITTDSSRTYKKYASKGTTLHFRPIEIDFWYPAQNSNSTSPLLYGYFLDLLEQRSNRFQNDTVYKQMISDLVAYLCANLKISDTSKLIQLPTVSYPNAIPFPKRFPLILYFCSYNGMSYENIVLFEFLAAHGYTVACITSVGRYPGNMSTQFSDLMEQVNDGAFSMRYLKTGQNIDTAKIGVMGYSWGGLAAMILVMNNTVVKCLLSLDGSEMHYYGDSREEDVDFDEIRNSPDYRAKKLTVPYAYLESGFKQSDQDADSIFNISSLPAAQNLYIHFRKAIHEDFSCLPSLGTNPSDKILYSEINKLSLYYFDLHLKNRIVNFPSFLDTIFRKGTGYSVYPLVKNKKDVFSIKGKIIDENNQDPLTFVNVGIRNKNTGTVSGQDGNFQMKINPELKSDSLTFSMTGYQTRVSSVMLTLN